MFDHDFLWVFVEIIREKLNENWRISVKSSASGKITKTFLLLPILPYWFANARDFWRTSFRLGAFCDSNTIYFAGALPTLFFFVMKSSI